MKAKSIGKRIEELDEKLHPRSPIDDLSEEEIRKKAKTAVLMLSGLLPPDLREVHHKEIKPVVVDDSEEALKEYEFYVEEFLDCGRSVNPHSEDQEIWEALWELEKEFAKKENRKPNFGINVLFVDKADDELFMRLRASCKIPSLSSEHRKAVKEVMAKIRNEKPNL
jgi:hypothetical protein